MIGWFSVGEKQRLQNDIAERDRMIKSLTADLNRMREDKSDEIKKDVQTSSFVIDWRNMDAFSIERMGDYKEAYTIIGYYGLDEHDRRQVREWKFYCSQEQHEKLAKEFLDYSTGRRK